MLRNAKFYSLFSAAQNFAGHFSSNKVFAYIILITQLCFRQLEHMIHCMFVFKMGAC